MDTQTGVRFTENAARKIVKATRQTLGTTSTLSQASAISLRKDRRYTGKLTSDLDAPTDGMASPTTATMKIWKPNPAVTTFPRPFIETSTEITAVNRDPSRAGVTDGWCKIEYLNGEWSFYDVECP